MPTDQTGQRAVDQCLSHACVAWHTRGTVLRALGMTRAGERQGRPPGRRNPTPMDPDRIISLTDAAVLSGCSRKALERRAERGSLNVTRDGAGHRAVRVYDLIRSGLLIVVPAGADFGVDPQRMAEAQGESQTLRTALAATESALRRARDEARVLRARSLDSEARAAIAEEDLTRVLIDGVPPQASTPVAGQARAGRLRLRTA